MRLRKVTRQDVVESLEASQEFDPVPDDIVLGKDVWNRHLNGDEWAWCMVTVKVLYGGVYGYSYLSNVSCEGRDDFVANSGYYETLVEEAVNDLNERLKNYADILEPLIDFENSLVETVMLS